MPADDSTAYGRAMVDALGSPVALVDQAGMIVEVNRAWSSFADEGDGDPAATGVGTSYLSVCDRAARDGDVDGRLVALGLRDVLSGHASRFTYDYPCAAPGGGQRWFELTVTPVPALAGALVVHSDVTARVLAQRANHRQARQDQLTGLANRLEISEVLTAELRRSSRSTPLSVLFLDVDLFKNVNDSLGHAVGDLLLTELARRLRGAVPDRALLGRFGGDEFIVVVPRCDGSTAAEIAADVRAAVSDPFDVAGTHLLMSLSIGLAVTEDPEGSPAELLRDADVALYAAKDGGRDRVHQFEPRLRTAAVDRLTTLTGLRRALREGEFRLHYQPVLDLRSGRVGGYEALMRWEDPVRGLQSPAAFIPLAEESGLIVPMSRWLLAEATSQAASWVRKGFPGKVGVNISAVHVTAGTLVDDVLEALDVAGLPYSSLLLEITESAVASDTDATLPQLCALRDHGVEIAIDDFGSGYSSLGQLAQLPATVLKLDRSLLPSGDDSPRSRTYEAIAGAVVAVGKALGMLVLAEGVETREELGVVQALGCDLAQGYLLGRPGPPETLSVHEPQPPRPRPGLAAVPPHR